MHDSRARELYDGPYLYQLGTAALKSGPRCAVMTLPRLSTRSAPAAGYLDERKLNEAKTVPCCVKFRTDVLQ